MKNNAYFQRLKTLTQKGVKTGAVPALLVNKSFALLISIIANAMEPSWDFTIKDGIFLTMLTTGIFMLIVFIGIMLIGLCLALLKTALSSKLAIAFGFIPGTIAVIAGNYILWNLFYQPISRNFETFIGEFLPIYFLPSTANILILANIGRKMNYSEHQKQP
ncbi:MAG TPA: hypothetical protein VKE92_16135 [Anaerolineales bacterium]|nr:hypothetical protein [Anaerolineales bacterium]